MPCARAAPVPTVICFCTRLTASTVSLKDLPTQQHTSSPTTIPPRAKANHTVPESPQESPCLSLSSPQMKSNRLNPVQMHVYELPQFLFYINTPLGDDGCNAFIPVLSPLPLVPGVQRIRSMPTSVTRDQSSRRRALKSASSRAQSVSYTACDPSSLYPAVVVTSFPPSNCNSSQFNLSPDRHLSSATEACCSPLLWARIRLNLSG